MKKIFLLLAGFLIISQAAVFSEEKPAKNYLVVSQLIEKAKDFDGQTILIKGEAIGDLMKRQDGTWLNISDGSAAIGIFFKKGQTECPPIKFLGDYKNKGDELEVTGIFNKACSYHNGETDIHCLDVWVLETGQAIAHPVGQKKVRFAVVLLFWSLIIFLLASLKNKTGK